MATPTVRQTAGNHHDRGGTNDAKPRSSRTKKTPTPIPAGDVPRLRSEKTAGPRTKMGAKGVKVGDLVLVDTEVGDRLALVNGGYMMGAVWMLQIGPVPCQGESGGPWLPQHVKVTKVKVVYRRAVR